MSSQSEWILNRLSDIFKRYRNDPVLFVREMLQVEPTEQQCALLEACAPEGAMVTIRSGHGVGKTCTLAWLILWFLWTRLNVRVPCTASTASQLRDVLWAELSVWRERLPKELRDATVIQNDRLMLAGEIGRTQYAVARTARREDPTAMHGFHAPHLLYVVDEASGVPDEVFEVMRGALTEQNARVVMTSNPTKVTGYFYDTHMSDGARNMWTRLHFSCLDSPLVSTKYVEQMKEEYGEGSDVYRVRVLGEFPRASITQFIPIDIVEEAQKRGAVLKRENFSYAPVILGADVSYFGDDRSALFLRQGLYAELLWEGRNIDTKEYADLIARFAFELKHDRVFVDVTGVGAGVVDSLRGMGVSVTGVSSASASSRGELHNKRMEMWWNMKEWLSEGGCIPNNVSLKEDLVAPEFTYSLNTGKMLLESKQSMKARKVRSPDLADALALTFSYPVSRGEHKTRGEEHHVHGGRRRSYDNVLS